MKTTLITFIAGIALAHAADARTWAWFHGDIGNASPFGSSSSAERKIGSSLVIKSQPASKRAVVTNKSKSKRNTQRIAER
jgi:hypothetical protein